MNKEIVLPDLGEGIDSAEISEVVVKEGDIVGPDDIILILESEKASMEIPAEVSGEIKEILVKAGQEVKTGQLLIRVEQLKNELEVSKKKTPLKESETRQEQNKKTPILSPVQPAQMSQGMFLQAQVFADCPGSSK